MCHALSLRSTICLADTLAAMALSVEEAVAEVEAMMRAGAGGGEFVNGEDRSCEHISSSTSTLSACVSKSSGAAPEFPAFPADWVLRASVGAGPASGVALAMAQERRAARCWSVGPPCKIDASPVGSLVFVKPPARGTGAHQDNFCILVAQEVRSHQDKIW